MTRTTRPNAPPSSEFALAIECCRWAFAGGDPAPVHRLTARVDWNRLVRLSRRHRIEGIVWHSLRSLAIALPAETERALAADAEAVAQHNLRAVRQSSRLLEAFRQTAIALIFIKGLSLSKLAYGDAFLKMSQDIDVLVPPDAIAEAAAELERLGFVMTLPKARLERW